MHIVAHPAFGWQTEAFSFLGTENGNLGVFTPPGTGKTASGIEALRRAGSGFIALPSTALANEKFDELCQVFGSHNVALGYRDMPLDWEILERHPYAAVSYDTLFRLARRHDFATRCKAVVLDEIHDQSPRIQLGITSMMQRHQSVRVVALSGTVLESDIAILKEWLNLKRVIVSDISATPINSTILQTGRHKNTDRFVGKLTVTDGEQRSVIELSHLVDDIPDATAAAYTFVRHTSKNQIFAYSSRRETCELIAQAILREKIRCGEQPRLQAEVSKLPKGNAGQLPLIRQCLEYGIVLYHGGIHTGAKNQLLALAKNGIADVVIGSLGLSQGVNLPAETVIVAGIRDPHETLGGPIQTIKRIRQVMTRAGRPQFHKEGRAVFIAQSPIDQVEIEEVYLKHKAGFIDKSLGSYQRLAPWLIDQIHNGKTTRKQLRRYLNKTLWAKSGATGDELDSLLDSGLDIIIEAGCAVLTAETYTLNDGGILCANSGLHPFEYALLREAIEERKPLKNWVRLTADIIEDIDGENFYHCVPFVADYGLQVHHIQRAPSKARILADEVQRLIGSSKVIVDSLKNPEVTEWWNKEIYHRFTFGEMEVACELAKVLPYNVVRRLVKNSGQMLQAGRQYTVAQLGDFAFAMYRAQHGSPPDRHIQHAAHVFGVATEAWLDIVQSSREEVLQ